jgi:hypothetical protein
MIVIRFGAASRTVTFTEKDNLTVQRNTLTRKQDDTLIRLVKFLTFGDK